MVVVGDVAAADSALHRVVFLYIAFFVTTVIAFFAILFTGRYPRSLFDFGVDYPERLSRGLVLVKWWLLAIPHYLVIAAIVGGVVHLTAESRDADSATIPLFGVLAKLKRRRREC